MGRGRIVTLAAAVAFVLWVTLLAALMSRPAGSAGPCVVVSGPALMPELTESSGLAVGRRNPDLVWSHNDSGNAAMLFGLDTGGIVRSRVRVPIRTADWEDISAAPCPSGNCLYIADIGDNKQARTQIRIYRIPEPAANDTVTAAPEVFSATYADGPHNAEAMFVVDANLFVVTRDRTGGLYRAAIGPDTHALTFRGVARLSLAAVTDAEASRDGTLVVVRTSHEAVLYRTADLIRGTPTPYLRVPLDGLREPQGEGVAMDGDILYLSSEGRPWRRAGSFLRLRCDLPQ